MPGPMSAPNGDRSLTNSNTRESLRDKGKLYTGKTDIKHGIKKSWRSKKES
jgi:hypothetical protein